jgi:hypothetical protein
MRVVNTAVSGLASATIGTTDGNLILAPATKMLFFDAVDIGYFDMGASPNNPRLSLSRIRNSSDSIGKVLDIALNQTGVVSGDGSFTGILVSSTVSSTGTGQTVDNYGVKSRVSGGDSSVVMNQYAMYGEVLTTQTVANAYGGYFKVEDQLPDTITNAYGAYSRILANGSIGTGYGYYASCEDASTCYGLYVNAGDPQVTTAWGLYVTGEDKNYVSGNLGIGTATAPGAQLDIDPTDVSGGAATERIALRSSAQTINLAEGANPSSQRQNQLIAPTITGTTGGTTETVTDAATLYIDNAPQVGADAAITNPYALWVDSGVARFDGNVTMGGQYGSDIYTIANCTTGSATINWNNGITQHITLDNNCTLTFSNGLSGRKYTLIVKQDTTGSRTITWPSGAGGARWSGNVAPTLTAAASKTDYIGFVYNSVDSRYDGVAERLNF